MLASRNLFRASAAPIRRRFISCEVKRNTVDPKLRQKQELFQADNDLPVFLKGGTTDRILYKLTMGLSLVGLGAFVHLIYDLDKK